MSKNSFLNQLLATLACNIITFSYGTTCAFGTVNFMLWMSDDTPLPSGKLTVFEASLVTSLLCVGSLFGSLIFISLSAKFGRKLPLLFLAIPQILSWVLFLVATNVWYFYISRLLAGIVGGGAFVLVPLYVSEIADVKVRGTLGALLILTCNAGVLFGFAVGFYDYYTQLKVLALVPALFFLAFNYFPESPAFLQLKQKEKHAEKSLSFFQGVKHVPKLEILEQELKAINVEEKPVDEKAELEKQQQKEEVIDEEDESLSLRDFLEPAAKKAMLIGVVMSFVNQLSGCFSMLTYTNAIFEEAGSSLSPNASAIIIALVQWGANCLTIAIVDRAGRKVIYSISAFGAALGLTVLGVHSLFRVQLAEHSWIPVVAFAFYIFIASIGLLPLHYVILVEIMPKKIQNVANLICMTILWSMASILLQIYPTVSQLLGMHTCMFFFATCCVSGAVFILTMVPETRGKSYEAIMRALESNK